MRRESAGHRIAPMFFFFKLESFHTVYFDHAFNSHIILICLPSFLVFHLYIPLLRYPYDSGFSSPPVTLEVQETPPLTSMGSCF